MPLRSRAFHLFPLPLAFPRRRNHTRRQQLLHLDIIVIGTHPLVLVVQVAPSSFRVVIVVD